jgi:hypothetical protein
LEQFMPSMTRRIYAFPKEGDRLVLKVNLDGTPIDVVHKLWLSCLSLWARLPDPVTK